MNWVRVEAKGDGDVVEYYYMNTETKETTWDRPNVEGEIPIYGRKFTGKVKTEEVVDDKPKPEDWWAIKTDDGEVYYMHRVTKTTTWDKPCEGDIELYGKKFVKKEVQEDTTTTTTTERSSKKNDNENSKEEDEKDNINNDDMKKAYLEVQNVDGLNPTKAPRRIALSILKQKWIKRTTGEIGDDADVYYLNVETNETSWEKPKDFGDDKKAKYEGIVFDEEEDFESNLKHLDFMSNEARKDRDLMIQKRDADAEKRVYKRLQSLHRLASDYGDDESWIEAFQQDDFALLREIIRYLGKGTSADVRSYTMRMLSFADDMCPEGTVKYMKEEMHYDSIWKHVEQAFREALSLCGHLGHEEGDEKPDIVSIRETSELLAGIVLYTRVEKEKSRPSSSLLDTMFSVMNTSLPQKTFMQMSNSICEINSLHEGSATTNPVMKGLASNPKSEQWSEALVYQLNETENSDEEALKVIIKVVIDIYAEKVTSNFFYTNDMNVLVDILIRELTDLPMESELRVDFLSAIENLMQNSPWFAKGQYRKDDVKATLDGIIEAYESDSSFSKNAYEKAKAVLQSSMDLLKE